MALDEEDKKLIAGLIGEALGTQKDEITKMVNGVAATMKKQIAGLPTTENVNKLVEEQTAAALEAVAKKKESETPKDPGGKKPAADPEVAAQLQELRTANEKLLKKVEEGQRLREQEQATRLAAEEKAAVNSMLAEVKVRPALVGPAYAWLRERGMVKRDDEGEIVIEMKGASGVTEAYPLKEGLTKWIKTEEGREFLPARDAAGAGDRKSGRGDRSDQENRSGADRDGYVPPTMEEVAQALQSED